MQGIGSRAYLHSVGRPGLELGLGLDTKFQRVLVLALCLVTFPVRRSRGEMYIGYGRLCVCVFVCPSPHFQTSPRTRMWVGGH